MIPTSSADVPFIFQEITNDYQAVSVQGQITYKIVNYKRVSEILDYTYDMKKKKYVTEDYKKISQRLVNITKVLTKKIIKGILKIKPNEGAQIFLTGSYNYVSACPKVNIHANDYYLYVKVFNDCCKEDTELLQKFPVAIEQFLEKDNIVDAYIAYEILVSQMLLTKNGANFFEIYKKKMITWFSRINAIFLKHKDRLREIKYGICKLYDNGLEDVISSLANMIDKELGIKLL